MWDGKNGASPMLMVMPEGIGDLVYASEDWVREAQNWLSAAWERRSALRGVGRFTFCVVAHNPPAHLRCGGKLAWRVRIVEGSIEAAVGELPADACDLKVEGDHAILSNLARVRFQGCDPALAAETRERLQRLTRWKVTGASPQVPALVSLLRELHDAMAPRTMPRFVFMTPEWVSVARHILSTRAEKYAEAIAELQYTFSEEFTDTPAYAFPDGSRGGFWARFDHGRVSVGAGPLPAELEPADALTKGPYTPVVPVGRTVNALMTDPDNAEFQAYLKSAFQPDSDGKSLVARRSPSGRGAMPPELGRIFLPLHDELSKRTSGELPADFDGTVKAEWSSPQNFDRDPAYSTDWLRYDRVDIYGNPRKS